MDRIDKIIGEINGTMAIENMPLTQEDREMLRRCMSGETTPEKERRQIIKQYSAMPER